MTARPYDREAGGGTLGESGVSGFPESAAPMDRGRTGGDGGEGNEPRPDSPSAPANPLLDQAVGLAESAWPGSTRGLRPSDEQQLRDELAAADQHDLQREYKW